MGGSGWVEYYLKWHAVAAAGLCGGVVLYVGLCSAEGEMWSKEV